MDRNIDIILRAKDLASGTFESVGNSAKSLSSRVTEFASSAATGAAIAGAAAAGGFALLGKTAISSAGDFEQSRVAFTTMLGSAAKASDLMKQISDFAQATPFELPEVVNGSKQLLAFGFAQEQILPTMRKLGDVAAGVGVPIGQLTTVFGQVRVSGRLMGQDLLQFTNAGVPMIEYLAKAMNVSQTSVKDMVEQGKVGFPQVQQALELMTNSGSKFGGLMEAQSHTLKGTLSNLSDGFQRMLRTMVGVSDTGEILADGVFDQVRAAINALIPVVAQLGQSGFNGLQRAIDFLYAAFDRIMPIIRSHADLLKQFGTNLAIITPIAMAVGVAFAFLTSPIGAFLIAITAAAAVVTAAQRVWAEHRAAVIAVGAALGTFAALVGALFLPALIAMAATAATTALTIAASWIIAFAPFIAIAAVVGVVAYEIATHWDGIKSAAQSLWDGITGIFNALVDFFSSNWQLILAVMLPFIGLPILIASNWDSIVGYFANLWGQVTTTVSSAITAIGQWFMNLPYTLGFALGSAAAWLLNFVTVDIPNFINAVGNWFAQLPGRIAGIMIDLANREIQGWINIYNGTVNLVSSIVSAVANFFAQLPGRAAGAASGLWGALVGILNATRNNMNNWANDAVNSVVNFFRSLPGKIADAMSAAVGAAKNAVSNFVSGFSLGFNKRALGGPVSADTPYLVGERGPELVIPQRAGTVMTNSELMASMGGGGGGGINITVQTGGGTFITNNTDLREYATSIAQQIANALKAQGLSVDQMGQLR